MVEKENRSPNQIDFPPLRKGRGANSATLASPPQTTRASLKRGDFRSKVALRRIVDEQLAIVSRGLKPLEKEIDDRPHPGADLLRQPHDVGVSGQIGEHPGIEEDGLDILRRQMEHEAARPR